MGVATVAAAPPRKCHFCGKPWHSAGRRRSWLPGTSRAEGSLNRPSEPVSSLICGVCGGYNGFDDSSPTGYDAQWERVLAASAATRSGNVCRSAASAATAPSALGPFPSATPVICQRCTQNQERWRSARAALLPEDTPADSHPTAMHVRHQLAAIEHEYQLCGASVVHGTAIGGIAAARLVPGGMGSAESRSAPVVVDMDADRCEREFVDAAPADGHQEWRSGCIPLFRRVSVGAAHPDVVRPVGGFAAAARSLVTAARVEWHATTGHRQKRFGGGSRRAATRTRNRASVRRRHASAASTRATSPEAPGGRPNVTGNDIPGQCGAVHGAGAVASAHRSREAVRQVRHGGVRRYRRPVPGATVAAVESDLLSGSRGVGGHGDVVRAGAATSDASPATSGACVAAGDGAVAASGGAVAGARQNQMASW
eukprot:ctg_2078.g530